MELHGPPPLRDGDDAPAFEDVCEELAHENVERPPVGLEGHVTGDPTRPDPDTVPYKGTTYNMERKKGPRSMSSSFISPAQLGLGQYDYSSPPAPPTRPIGYQPRITGRLRTYAPYVGLGMLALGGLLVGGALLKANPPGAEPPHDPTKDTFLKNLKRLEADRKRVMQRIRRDWSRYPRNEDCGRLAAIDEFLDNFEEAMQEAARRWLSASPSTPA